MCSNLMYQSSQIWCIKDTIQRCSYLVEFFFLLNVSENVEYEFMYAFISKENSHILYIISSCSNIRHVFAIYVSAFFYFVLPISFHRTGAIQAHSVRTWRSRMLFSVSCISNNTIQLWEKCMGKEFCCSIRLRAPPSLQFPMVANAYANARCTVVLSRKSLHLHTRTHIHTQQQLPAHNSNHATWVHCWKSILYNKTKLSAS